MNIKIKFKRFSSDVILPTFAHEDDAGMDFYSPEDFVIPPNDFYYLDLGIGWEPCDPLDALKNHKVALLLTCRSGLAFKKNIEVSNAGLIDESYRGSIHVKIYNHSTTPFFCYKFMKIVQGIVLTLPRIVIEETSELSETKRNTKGLGSSGY